jgi:hypothetical protein
MEFPVFLEQPMAIKKSPRTIYLFMEVLLKKTVHFNERLPDLKDFLPLDMTEYRAGSFLEA